MSNPRSSAELPTHPESTHPMIHLPRPTIWPAVMAAGITMVASGLIISLYFSLVGVIVFAIALGGWIGELRNG